MLKIATEEDIPVIKELAMKFANSTSYADYVDEAKADFLIQEFLKADKSQKIVLLYDNIGILAGMVQPFFFGNVLVASEVLWWVEPDERGKKAGEELLNAFEFWAQKVGCKLITMVCLNDSVGKYYEKRGYRLYENAYMKEL